VYLKGHAVKTPADLKGMKIRVMQSETNLKMMELMGGVGTPMGQGEVYTAIQTGVIDGGENNELIYSDLKHCEIAPYYSYTRHLMIPDYLIISKDVYEKLPADVKKIFDEELAKAVESEFKMFNDNIAKAKAKAEKAGAKFNDVDMDAFMKAVAPLTKEKLKTDLTKKLYKEIRALD
jgi:TRAP-type C4-dicarboxylate transport system substrate-binding protein